MIDNISEIYFETYGCTANQNSTEIMKGLVKQAGINLTSNSDFADLIIINSCIVKEATQNKIQRRLQDLLNSDKKIILAGCLPSVDKNLFQEHLGRNLFLLGTFNVKNLIDLIQDIKNNSYELEKYLKQRNEIKSNLPKISENKLIGINQISEGCLGECAYCIVRLAKGKLFSYPKEKIIESVQNDINAGCKEIWITSQDNAAYGTDEGKFCLPGLLNSILEIPGRFYVRIGMMSPNNVLKILPELIETYKNPKMFKFLHIPIQSSSDKILKDMNRKYNSKDILKIVSEFKKQIPEITIATDIIIGYPGETDEDWNQTLKVIKEIQPEILNRSNFSPHKKTPAGRLPQLNPDIINSRANELMKLHLDICNKNQEKYLNQTLPVLIDSKGFENTWLGRTENYKLVAVQSRDKLLGKKVNVKINKLTPHYLIGEESE